MTERSTKPQYREFYTTVAILAENKEATFGNRQQSPVVSRSVVPPCTGYQVMGLPVHARMDGVTKTVGDTSVDSETSTPLK
jgi:hypothetical protein